MDVKAGGISGMCVTKTGFRALKEVGMTIAARSFLAWTLAAFVLLFASSGVSHAAPSGDELVQVKLLADVASIEPAKPFNVGVNMKIAPGWHTYWINPGDSGEATHVTFDLPPGFTAGELKFPVPERIVLPGDIVSFGYENEVTLMATITPPANLKPGQTISISAKADWLVCEKICLPGEGRAKLDLPVSAKGEAANKEFFDSLWFPIAPAGTVSPANVSVGAKSLDLTSGKGQTEIRLSAEVTGDIDVFPYPLDNVTLSIGKARRDGSVLVIPISASVLPGQTVSAKTFSVLVVSRSKPNRFAYDVPVTIINK
jgi:DsbC/DsbD-like thiol-disulfide interchange protein